LIRIKTRILLPTAEEEDEEEIERELESQGFFQQVAGNLKERYSRRARLYDTRPDLPETVESGDTQYREVTLFELIEAFQKIQATQQDNTMTEVEITNEFDTHERMEYLLERVQEPRPIPFQELLSEAPTREEVIVTFLAILQLVKQEDLRLVREVGEQQIYVMHGERKADVA
ncbi:MAG: segregation/condensation protein A, partial [bacterium]